MLIDERENISIFNSIGLNNERSVNKSMSTIGLRKFNKNGSNEKIASYVPFINERNHLGSLLG